MKKILISVGELSGDEHAAQLALAIKKYAPNTLIQAMGGDNLKRVGAEIIIDIKVQASVMGFSDVLKSFSQIKQAFSRMREQIITWKPDLLILIDYPDFNLRLAKVAKTAGVKVFYYIIPKMWAWRQGRTRLFERYVDFSAVIFPFERDFMQKRGYKKVVYVGHPFSTSIRRHDSAEIEEGLRLDFFKRNALDPSLPLLAIFPGSREGEIKRHLAAVSEASDVLHKRNPELQIICAATAASELALYALAAERPHLKVVSGQSLDVLRFSTAGLLKSGTSNLQAAFFGLPFAMFFIVSKFSEKLLPLVLKTKEYSIVNILRSGSVPELLQSQTRPEVVVPRMESLLFDPLVRENMQAALRQVVESLAKHEERPEFLDCHSTSDRAAKVAISLLF